MFGYGSIWNSHSEVCVWRILLILLTISVVMEAGHHPVGEIKKVGTGPEVGSKKRLHFLLVP